MIPRSNSSADPRPETSGPGEERFRELFENAHDFVYTTDLAGNFTAANHAGERVTGYPREELLAANIARIIAPEHLVLVGQMTDHIVGGGGPIVYEVEIVTKDGRRVPLEVSTRVIYESGKPAGLHGVARNIAWRRRTDEAVRRRVTHLEALNAITVSADSAPALPPLLEVAIDRMLAVLQLGIGGVWVGEDHVTRGLSPIMGAVIVDAARRSGAETPTAMGVEDWHTAHDRSGALGDAWNAIGIRASLVVPITAVGECVGALAVASARPRPWLLEEIALIESVAQQLGATVEGLRLFRETQRHVELTGRLIGLNDTLHRQSSVAAAVSAIGHGAMDLSGAQAAAVYLRLPDDKTVGLRWSQGLASDPAAYLVAAGIAQPRAGASRDAEGLRLTPGGPRLEEGGPMLFSDVGELPAETELRRLSERDGYRAFAVWPLTYEGRVIAWVSCFYGAPHVGSKAEREVLQTFTWQAADALEHARLSEEQAQRTAELETLFDLGGRLRAARAPEEVFEILSTHVGRLLHADHVALTLLSPDGQWFTRVHEAGMFPAGRESTFSAAGSLSGRVVQTGIPHLTADVAKEFPPDWLDTVREVHGDLGPVSVVALRFEHEVIGTIMAGRTRGEDRLPFTQAEVRLLQGIAEMGGTAIHRARLVHNLEQSYIQMVLVLARAVDVRDSYTGGHSERLAEWAEGTARALGCREAEVQDIRWGALLHDIGKIGVPDAILKKPGRLTDEEWRVMRAHPITGEEILRPVERMREVARILRHHHEQWDGTGYPDRLQGDGIPLGARILAVVDAYSAIVDERPYKKPSGHEEAVVELRRSAGTHFDPQVVEIFLKIIGLGTTGSETAVLVT